MLRTNTIFITACILALAGCGDGNEELRFPDRAVSVPDAAEKGQVSGKVNFLGDPPKLRPLRSPSPSCNAHNGEIPDESIVVKDGQLKGVLVYIQEGLEAFTFPLVKDEALIDQSGCQFVPHVLAVQAFQPIRIKNSDAMAHNVNLKPKTQEGFLVSFAGQGTALRQLAKPELSMRATCDLHGNMLMYIHVLDHPYFQVTDDDGTFSFTGLPAGTYRIAARHEELGEQSRLVTIEKDGEVKGFDFDFER